MKKIKAKKSLGQNFLQDETILNTIASFIEVEGKNIVEVGPGYGALTEKLIQKNPAVLQLVELDRDMIHLLEEKIFTGEFPEKSEHFQIFHQDILTFIPNLQKYSVIANIPYYITSPILFHFLYNVPHSPDNMIIMMQKEVGEKILDGSIGGKGKMKNSLLSLAIWKKCNVEMVCKVPRGAFFPPPKVDSIVLFFEKEEKNDEVDDKNFIAFLKEVFKEPRKTLQNNLLKAYSKESISSVFLSMELSEKVGGEELTGETIIKLFKSFEEIGKKI